MFTWVVFIIVLIVGISFLSAKYFSESRTQKKEMLWQINTIVVGIQRDRDFLTKYSRQKIIEEIRQFRPWDIKWDRFANNSRISFLVLDSENNLVFKEILQEPKFDEIDFETKNIYRDSGILIATREVDDNRIIFYQNIDYEFEDFFSDVLLLLFLATLLSGFVYFIWYRFVWETLLPVEENMKDMWDFIHNAGHELKTPLSVIRWNLQVMSGENELDPKLIKKSIAEIDRANDLIEGLRELSEVGKIAEKSNFAIATEVKKVLESYQKLISKKDINVYNNAKWWTVVYANREELTILISNLIKNAILYNTKKWEIFLDLQKNVLTIRDTWKGMSQQEISKIFDRLYRWTESRNIEWFWIGLSLVKKIVDANGWKISVKSEEGKWSTFEIVF